MSSPQTQRLSLLAIVLIVGLLVVGARQTAYCADEGEQIIKKTAESGTLRFRRVYAPADRLGDLPGIHAKHIPMNPAEFQQLLENVQAYDQGLRISAADRLLAAVYRARLIGDRLTDAKAILQFEQSDQLEFAWSKAGFRDAAGVIGFSFELLPCPANRLLLDLPEGATPTVDRGVVLKATEAAELTKGYRRWRIELGGHNCFQLRVIPNRLAEEQQRPILLRQSVVYDFSLHGAEVLTQLEVEVSDKPLCRFAMVLDDGLRPVSAQYGEALVPWSLAPQPDGKSTRAVLVLPEPVQNKRCVLRLKATAELVTDRLWRLPRIRLEEAFWQEGKVTLRVVDPLMIEQLRPIDSRQSGTDSLSGQHSGESVRFQCFSPDATVEILLARRYDPVQLTSATAVELGGTGMTADVTADFHTDAAPRFVLTADLAPQWLVDSVESMPVDVIADWAVEHNDGHRVLTIQLAKSISPGRPVRLRVAARRLQSPLGCQWGVDELVPLRFHVSDEQEGGLSRFSRSENGTVPFRLVSVRAAESYKLKISGDDRLNRIDAVDLKAAELELFADAPRGVLFQNDAGAAELRIALERQKPSYTATIRVEANVVAGQLQESYLLRCVPNSGRLSSVVVHFSHRRAVPPDWTLGGNAARQLVARQLSDDEQLSAGMSPEGETWELTFRRPRSVPFEIRAVRQTKAAEHMTVSLASLPNATDQTATLVVRSPEPAAVRVENHGLVPIPVAPAPPQRCRTTIAAYRYDPLHDVSGAAVPAATQTSAAVPAVTISILPEQLTARAWVWHCRLDSRYEPDGIGRHTVTYHLQNSGAKQLRLTLPDDVTVNDVHGVWVDAKQTDWRRLASRRDNRMAIDLPQNEKFPSVSICFTTVRRRLGMVGSLKPPLPDIALEIVAGQWTVWLPPGYETFDPDLRWQADRTPQISFSRRLFGPLGRDTGRMPFNPLSVKSWTGVFGNYNDRQEAERKTERLLQLLGELAAKHDTVSNGNGLCWAKLLSNKSIDTLQLKLLVDRRALARLKLLPQTTVPSRSGNTPAARGISLLQNAALAVLVHRDAVVLTSREEAALYHAWLAPLGQPFLWWVLPGPLEEQLRRAAAGTPQGTIVSVDAWSGDPPEPTPPWGSIEPAGIQGTDLYGWSAYRLTLLEPSNTHVRVKFFHRSTMRLLGAISFLSVVALVWWKARGRPVLLTVLLGAFGLTAVTLSDAYVPVASGAVLGVLFSIALQLVGPPRATSEENSRQREKPPSSVSISTQLWTIVTVTLATSILCASAFGQEDGKYPSNPSKDVRSDRIHAVFPGTQPRGPDESGYYKPADTSPVYQVLIPIGDQEQSAGGKVYLPQEFYNRLRRRQAKTLDQLQGRPLDVEKYRRALSGQTTPVRPVADIEELLWLKIQPGSVVVDAKFKFTSPDGQPARLQLSADPRWRVLPPTGENPPQVHIDQSPGKPQTITLILPETAVKTSFLLRGATGTGRLRLPQLELLGGRPKRRWIAVSVDPQLEYEISKFDRTLKVKVSDFLNAWGNVETQPQFVFCEHPGKITWSIATRPRRTQTTVRQTTIFSFDRQTTEVRFDAELVTTAGYNFQYRVHMPSEMKVDEVSVVEEGEEETVEHAKRFSRNIGGVVTVFLDAPLSGRQKLSLRGQLPIQSKEEPSLPVLKIDQCRVLESKVQTTSIVGGDSVGDPVQSPSETPPTAGLPSSEHPHIIRNAARVSMADIHIAWQADGVCHGVATFDVELGNASDVPLVVPAECRVVQVLVDQLPRTPEPISADRWLVPLGPVRLPQRIEVVFTGTVSHPTRAGRHRFEAPSLGELPVERTLWTVAGPSMFEPGSLEGVKPIVSPKLLTDPPPAADPAGLWNWSLDHRQAVSRCAFDRRAGSIVLDYRRAESGRMRYSFAMAVGIVLFTAVTVFALRRGRLTDWCKRHPWAVSIVIVLIWWLWLFVEA